jgi:4-hydroxy-3-polyprenylbenzoate decarboxylase
MSDLNHFLGLLEEEGDLIHIGTSVSTKFDIASMMRHSLNEDGPALMFHEVLHEGKKSQFPVVANVYGAERRIRRIFSYGREDINKPKNTADDMSTCDLVSLYSKCATVPPGPSKELRLSPIISPGEYEAWVGDEVDLYNLPICWYNEKDSGYFITSGVQVVQYFNGTMGLGIHRMKVVDKNTLSCLAPPNRRVGLPHYKASEKGESVNMAVLIGAPPSVVLASQAKLAFTDEKYLVANNIAPIELLQLPNGLHVPYGTEIILECECIPNSVYDDTKMEGGDGPTGFLEYPGTYSARSNSFLVRVVRIWTKKNAVFQALITGAHPNEDCNLCAIPYSAEVYRTASYYVRKITDISCFLGNNVFDTIVCIEKDSNEQVTNLMYALLANRYLKSVSIMDSDLMATEKDWRFAFNTRYQPNRDTIITNLGLGASLDPSSPLFQSTSKIAMDMTVPIGKDAKDTAWQKFRHMRGDTQPISKRLLEAYNYAKR